MNANRIIRLCLIFYYTGMYYQLNAQDFYNKGYYWTNYWISEEEYKGYEAQPGYYLAGYECSGKYCDSRKLYFVSLPNFDRTKCGNIFINWSPFISEELKSNSFIAPNGNLIAGLKCSGSYCDNISFLIAKNRQALLYIDKNKQFWSPWISEEIKMNKYIAPQGHFIIGYECKDKYCDNRRFLVAPLKIPSKKELSATTQMKIQNKGQYLSPEISRISKNMDAIKVKTLKQNEIFSKKKFVNYDEAIDYLTQCINLSKDIINYNNSIEQDAKNIYSDKLNVEEITELNNQLLNLLAFTEKMELDILSWNPDIANQPLKKARLKSEQLTKKSAYWTNTISEEQGKINAKCGYYLAGYRCSGSYCDNRQLYFVSYPAFDKSQNCNSTTFTSAAISEERPSNVFIVPQGFLINGISCQGSYCDNLKFAYSENNKADISVNLSKKFWSTWISEETGKNEYIAPDGHFIIGYECRGSYCDDRRFLVAPLSSLSSESNVEDCDMKISSCGSSSTFSSSSSLEDEISSFENEMEAVRNKRQEYQSMFENFDCKANQLFNLLSSVLKDVKEMQSSKARNIL
ncbi:MAG: hypothetical protein JXJ22_15225 [Bacteroidales bacterium]|nr:hypothetical protein [Bacteroidales bacterium]